MHCIEGMEINMNILIVEDDNLQAEALKMIISEYNSSWIFFIANDTIIATSLFTNNTIDIFFLDIEFTKKPETNGLILAESIRANPLYQSTPILFITGYKDKIYNAINTIHCFDYILKPYSKSAIFKTLDDLSAPKAPSAKSITIKDFNGVYIVIYFEKLIYAESYNHGVMFHTVDGDFHYIRHCIADLTDILDSSFLQIHKKYIVNKSFITSYDKTTRYLHINGVALPVGRVYKPEVDYYIDERIQN